MVYAPAISYTGPQTGAKFGVKKFTERAILIEVSHSIDNHFVWLPLSQIAFYEVEGTLYIEMPYWLAAKNGLNFEYNIHHTAQQIVLIENGELTAKGIKI